MKSSITALAVGLAFCFSAMTLAADSSTQRAGQVDLLQLYQQAQQADPRILKAQAQRRSKAGREREAFGQLLPQLNASGSFNRSRREDDLTRTQYNGERYALTLSQVLYAPRVWRSYQKFSSLAEQGTFEYEDARIQASIDLVERYFTVLAAEDELSLVRAELKATERNLARVNSLFERKMAMVTDVLELEARVDALKADEIEARNQVELSREALVELVGHEVPQSLKRIAERPTFTLPAQSQEYWVETALAVNPALQARRMSLTAASAALGEAKAGHLPTLSFNLSAQRSDIGYEGTLTPRSDTYVAGIGLQVPLYSGGSTRARVESSYADLQAAEQELEALRRQIVRETRTAFLGMEAAISRTKASRRALESAEKSRLAAEKAFEYGVMNGVDVLDSIEEEFRARRDLFQAQYNFITSLLVLHRWSGRLEEADIRRANGWLVSAP